MAYFRANPVNSVELFTSKKTHDFNRLVFLLTLILLKINDRSWQQLKYRMQTSFKANT
jgi:hypothetical protein